MKINKKNLFFIKKIIKIINSIKGKNIKIINTRYQENNLFNFFIICNGESSIHIKTIYNKIVIFIKKKFKILPINIEGLDNLKWVLIDYNFIIINIFLEKIRLFYKIDLFWEKIQNVKIIKF